MDTATHQLRRQVVGSFGVPVDTATLLIRLIDIVDEQQEQIGSLRKAIEQQAEKLEGKTAQLGRRVSKLEGVHGA